MSPEQVRGKDVDARSDLFSLAVVLYESLCGVRPFTGEDFTALAYAIVHESPVPVTKRATGLPRGLDRFFDRALAKEPAERFASGAEFARALDEAFRDDGAADHEPTVVDAPAAAREDFATGDDPAETPVWGVESDDGPLPLPEIDISRRVRRRIFIIAACFLLLVVGGWALLGGEDDAYLKLDAKSSMEAGELSLLVDGEEVYSRSLSAPEQKGKGLLKKIINKKHETF